MVIRPERLETRPCFSNWKAFFVLEPEGERESLNTITDLMSREDFYSNSGKLSRNSTSGPLLLRLFIFVKDVFAKPVNAIPKTDNEGKIIRDYLHFRELFASNTTQILPSSCLGSATTKAYGIS